LIVATASGVKGATVTISWTVDTTAPVSTITSPATDLTTNKTDVTFAFTANEPATFLCSLDGAAGSACSSPLLESGLTDGSHIFQVTATDRAGNIEPSGPKRTVIVDTTAPQTTITAGPMNGDTTGTSVTFGFSSSEGGSTFTCKLDTDASASPCSSPLALTGLGLGTRTFTVFATDPAGNADATPATVTWNVDGTPPTVTYDSPAAGSTTGPSTTVSWHANETATWQCALDAAALATCSGPSQPLSGLSGGGHTYHVQATDVFGNVSGIFDLSWTVDATAPRTVLTSEPSDPSTASVTFQADSSPHESGLTFACTLDGQPVSCPGGTFTTTINVDGKHTFTAAASDQYGNQDPVGVSYTWTTDGTAPTWTFQPNIVAVTNRSDLTINFTPSEAVHSVRCNLDGAGPAACPPTNHFTNVSALGTHTLVVTGNDAVNNVGSSTYTWQRTNDALIQLPFSADVTSNTGAFGGAVSYTNNATIVEGGGPRGGYGSWSAAQPGSPIVGTSGFPGDRFTIGLFMQPGPANAMLLNDFDATHGLSLQQSGGNVLILCAASPQNGNLGCVNYTVAAGGGWHFVIIEQDASPTGTGAIQLFVDGTNPVAQLNEPKLDPILIGAQDMVVGGPGAMLDDVEMFDDAYNSPGLCATFHAFFDITTNTCNLPKPTIDYSFDGGDASNSGSTGLTYNGQISNITFAPGRNNIGQAAKFRDNSSSILPVNPTNAVGAPLVTTDASPSMTMGFWFQSPQSIGGDMADFYNNQPGGAGLAISQGFGFAIYVSVPDGDPAITTTTPPPNTWHHLIIRYLGQNATTGLLTSVYLDDVLVGSFPTTSFNPFSVKANPLFLGSASSFLLDDFVVYPLAMDPIQQCQVITSSQWLYSSQKCDYQ
jgi:hypothetical protein